MRTLLTANLALFLFVAQEACGLRNVQYRTLSPGGGGLPSTKCGVKAASQEYIGARLTTSTGACEPVGFTEYFNYGNSITAPGFVFMEKTCVQETFQPEVST